MTRPPQWPSTNKHEDILYLKRIVELAKIVARHKFSEKNSSDHYKDHKALRVALGLE